jgi:hypothetical protein
MTHTLLVGLCIFLAGCAHLPSPEMRLQSAQAMAAQRQWQWVTIATNEFDIAAAYSEAHLAVNQSSLDQNNAHQKKPDQNLLAIFIEGDGLAWITGSQPSEDPTPLNPVALSIALNQPGRVAYLARPCQFQASLKTNPCQQQYWTSARFSQVVINAMNQAVSELKARHGAKQLVLVGYSGGGAVAALVAARRTDVLHLVTIAGNLDPVFWAKEGRLTPLGQSLNPADFWQQLAGISQIHFVGVNDQVVPESVAKSFIARFPAHLKPTLVRVPGFDHQCCWAQRFAELIALQHLKNFPFVGIHDQMIPDGADTP